MEIFQGESGAEDRYRPGEGQRGKKAGWGAGDDHSLQHPDEEHRQPGRKLSLELPLCHEDRTQDTLIEKVTLYKMLRFFYQCSALSNWTPTPTP